jgi:hypothetical protein
MAKSDYAKYSEYYRNYHKKYYAEHKEKIQAYYIANREKIIARYKAWRKNNKEKCKARSKIYEQHRHRSPILRRFYDVKRSWKRKLAIIKKYGGECKFCGVKDPTCLSLDHINNDGYVERRRENGSNTSVGFYRRLLRAPVRSDLQILCMNCQWRKRMRGPDYTKWPDIKSSHCPAPFQK